MFVDNLSFYCVHTLVYINDYIHCMSQNNTVDSKVGISFLITLYQINFPA